MNRMKIMTRVALLWIIVFIIRLKYEFSISWDGDIEDWCKDCVTASLGMQQPLKSAGFPIVERL